MYGRQLDMDTVHRTLHTCTDAEPQTGWFTVLTFETLIWSNVVLLASKKRTVLDYQDE